MARPRKEACLRGHALTEENRGPSGCRMCHALRAVLRGKCGKTSGYKAGCRCEACRGAVRRAEQERAARRLDADYAPDTRMRLPAAPLKRLIAAFGGSKPGGRFLAGRLGGIPASHERRLARILISDTVTVYTADEVCMAFGRHPFEIYGLEFYADLIQQEGATDVA